MLQSSALETPKADILQLISIACMAYCLTLSWRGISLSFTSGIIRTLRVTVVLLILVVRKTWSLPEPAIREDRIALDYHQSIFGTDGGDEVYLIR